jgi:archaeal flagellin FlaB
MKSMKPNSEDGFTGLEAAIVLIAFVVVAAVFSYVVLGAGFFTTQKAQETVHTGVQQTTSAVEPSGPVSIEASGSTAIKTITFYLQLAAGGTGIDMGKVTYAVSTPKKVQTFTNAQVSYSWVKENTVGDAGHTTTAGMLGPREMVLVSITPAFSATDMTVNDKFIVEVRPPIGAALPIARTIPGSLATGKWYEVF